MSPQKAGTPATSAIIVAYRSADCIAACLASLEPDVLADRAEVIVVDNASPDDSAALVRVRYPWARLVRLPRNLGFAGGVNCGIAIARGDNILLLNPDAEVLPGTLAGLTGYLAAHPSVAAVGPRVRRHSGKIEASASFRPTFSRLVVSALGLIVLAPWVPSLRSIVVDRHAEAPESVDVISGCCMVIRREALERIGEFDERFFMYLEDVDWCLRARAAGFEVHFAPGWEVLHERGHGGANESLTPVDSLAGYEYLFEKHRIPHNRFALRLVRRAHYLTAAAWMGLRYVTGQPGAGVEIRRLLRTFVLSFGRSGPGSDGGVGGGRADLERSGP